MGRIFLCPIVGEGTADDPIQAKARRYLTAGLGVTRVRAAIKTNRTDPTHDLPPDLNEMRGRPTLDWSICYVEATDWTLVDSDPDIILLADLDTPGKLNRPLPPDVKSLVREKTGISQGKADALPDIRRGLDELVKTHYPGHTLQSAGLAGD